MLRFGKTFEYGSGNTSKKPIAEINDGYRTKGYIYFEDSLDDPDSDRESESDDSEEERDDKCQFCGKIFSGKAYVRKHILNGSCKAKLIADFMKYSGSGVDTVEGVCIKNGSVELTKYKFSPLADKWNRENIVVIGPQNSGKSYWTSMYAQSYQSLFDNNVIIVSRIEDDASFTDINDPVRVSITEELLGNPIDIKAEMSPSLTIFDDIDDSRYSSELSKYVWNLNTETLVNGRDQSGNGEHIYTVTTMHITEGSKTRKIVNEASTIVLFLPIGYQEQRILRMYCGLSLQQINRLKKLKSRWVTCYCKYRPQFIMTERGLYLVSDF